MSDVFNFSGSEDLCLELRFLNEIKIINLTLFRPRGGVFEALQHFKVEQLQNG